MPPTATEHGDEAVTAPPLQRLPRRPRGRLHARLQAAKRFCCRLEVCWTAAFAVILVGLAVAVTATTQVQVTRSLVSTWHATHHARIAYNTRRLSIGTDRVHDIANGFMSLNMPGSNTGRVYTPPSLICSTLDNYDKKTRFRALLLISIERDVVIGCMHGIESTGSLRTLTGLVSEDAIINGSYLVDNTTYRFVEPRRMMSEWPASARNLSLTVRPAYADLPVFTLLPAYLNGSIDRVDPRLHWMQPTQMPHLILYSLPVGYLARGLDTLGDMNYTDFTQVRLDGSRLLLNYDYLNSPGFSAAAFINQSLGDADPLVLSNNWGQRSVSNDEIYAILSETVTYLRVSEISDPLMRAGLKHVDLAQLQREGSNQTVDFEYAGAVATVTLVLYTTARGLVVPLVFVSSHAAITGPYLHYFRIFDAVLAAAVVLCTAAFWYCARHFISQPLRRMTALLLASADAGRRALLYRPTNAVLQLAEVQALGQAHNAAVERLREIDAFVPAAPCEPATRGREPDMELVAQISVDLCRELRHAQAHARDVMQHELTVVYLSIRPAPRSERRQAAQHRPGSGSRLVTAVERAAQQVGAVNSGPFPSPAALAAFVAAVQELCRMHHGTAHRVCPDGCVLHFNSAVRAHMLTPEAVTARWVPTAGVELTPELQLNAALVRRERQRCVKRDARDAAAFALALVDWLDSTFGAADGMPDVRALLDTALFACGQYRPLGSEQTLQVALGRDVQRDVGGVARRIGVRVAMTEETAVRVRAEVLRSARGCARVESGVRQLPVEALRTGRAGLDDNVLVLYEALPGRVAGDAAWQRYARCCFDGFALMVRGDYAGARRAYGGVADIADLEPGLLPPSLSREAARSDVRGGAVSTQVARLVRECERRLLSHTSQGFHRVRAVPLGIDALLPRGQQVERVGAAAAAEEETVAGFQESEVPRGLRVLMSPTMQRLVITVETFSGTVRCVVGGQPTRIEDNHGGEWWLPAAAKGSAVHVSHQSRMTALNSAGVACSVCFIPFLPWRPLTTKVIRDAQDGPLSAALRSAVPVCEPSDQQRVGFHRLVRVREVVQHPNLLQLYGYSLSAEGLMAALSEFAPGGSLRDLQLRYREVSTRNAMRCCSDVCAALAYLHERGYAHGAVSPDNCHLATNGSWRLASFSPDHRAARATLALPLTCYVSPQMAAGALPTPACDMFCYGLMVLEMVCGEMPWRWAGVEAEQGAGTAQELEALTKRGGLAFCRAVAAGRVVVAVERINSTRSPILSASAARETVRLLLSYDPALRPSASAVQVVNKALLRPLRRRVHESESQPDTVSAA